MDTKKEIGDQAAHFAAGASITIALSMWVPISLAVIFTATFAYLREVLQRISRGDPWYECGPGCMLDLSFWAIGISASAYLVVLWNWPK